MFATFCVVYLMVLVVELMVVGLSVFGYLAGRSMASGNLFAAYGAWCATDLACSGAATLLELLAALL